MRNVFSNASTKSNRTETVHWLDWGGPDPPINLRILRSDIVDHTIEICRHSHLVEKDNVGSDLVTLPLVTDCEGVDVPVHEK
jgi:hypothetical protein